MTKTAQQRIEEANRIYLRALEAFHAGPEKRFTAALKKYGYVYTEPPKLS